MSTDISICYDNIPKSWNDYTIFFREVVFWIVGGLNILYSIGIAPTSFYGWIDSL